MFTKALHFFTFERRQSLVICGKNAQLNFEEPGKKNVSTFVNDAALFTISQKAIIKDKKGRILMMEKAGKGHWDLPGGKLDEGEDMLEGISREIVEETNLSKVNIGSIIYAGRRSFEEKGKPERVMIFYECECEEKFDKIKLSDEHSEWRLMTADDIQDSKKYEINPVVFAALEKAFAKK